MRSRPPTTAKNTQPQPLLLRSLLILQQGSSILSIFLVGTVLVMYAATVYLQQQWSEAYRTLERLQRETRNLTAADETLKNDLANQAQTPEARLVFPSPDKTIYLSPSETAPPPETAQNVAVKEPSPSNVPLGY